MKTSYEELNAVCQTTNRHPTKVYYSLSGGTLPGKMYCSIFGLNSCTVHTISLVFKK